MAQNEMKAKPSPPERVRSMEGLGLARADAHLRGIVDVVRDITLAALRLAHHDLGFEFPPRD